MSEIKQSYKQTKVGIIPEDWEVVKLSAVFSKSFYGTSDSTNEIGKYPVLRMGNMQNGTLDLKDLVYLDLEEKEFKKYQLKKGDILLNRTNSYELVGKISLFDLDGDYISASYIVAYRPNFKVINSIFINNLLNTTYFQEKTRTIATKGVSQANINPTSFKEVIKIPLPPLKEQEKIAQIFTTWDEAITKQTQLLRAKELQKKALMQKLLSGEVRFSGFSDEWEEVRLGEICDIKKGEQLNKDTLENDGEFPVINGGIEPSGFTDDWNTEANTITISEGGNSCGYVNFLQDKFWSGGHCYTLLNLQIDNVFLYQFLKYNQHNIMKLRVGSGLPNIQKSAIEKFIINKPSFGEQQKIAEVLSLADDEINLLNNELEELKQQKKALMQKLLTGQVRVKV